jgi:hypothetical protein
MLRGGAVDDHAGDVGQLLADRYRLLLSPAEAEDAMQWRAYDTAAEQEVLVRQVPLPEVVEAELVDEEPPSGGGGVRGGAAAARRTGGRATRRPADPGVRRALEAALAAARLPDHPRLGQVFDVFVEGDGLWVVSELLPARPLAALLAERPLSPHRAAEIGADLVAALRAVHAQGWTHRNVTARTVLVCDDGHAMLTGLAAGAAEETLCGYDVLPRPAAEADADADAPGPGPGTPDGGVAAGDGRPAGPGGGADGPQPGTGAADAAPRPGASPAAPGRDGGAAGDGSAATLGGGFAGDKPGPGAAPARPGGEGGRRAGELPERAAPASSGGEEDSQPGGDEPSAAPGGVPGQRAEGTAWWQDGPVRGAPWDEPGSGGEAHAYGAAEQRPGRPHEGDGPTARAARRGAIAAYHAGTRAAAEHRDDERWPFASGDPQDAASGTPSPGGARPPAEPPTDRASAREWWPFDEAADDLGQAPGEPDAEPRTGQWWPFEDGPEPEAAARAPRARNASRPSEDGAGRGTPALPDGWVAAEPEASPARSALGSERARDARLAAVGAVTERWAPEQAGARQPVGPAADLWALGALLFRAVQGRPPYPEEAAAELVQLVRTRPPESDGGTCGPLQPVVESLLRQDPAQRADVGELRDRLLAIVRAAPEPEVGRHTLVGPPSLAPGQPADPRRLPIVRRRGELVRRRRAAKRPRPAKPVAPPAQAKAPTPPSVAPRHRHTAPAAPAPRRAAGGPRHLGRLLVGLILLLLTGAVLYAMWFMPQQGASSDDGVRKERSSVGEPAPQESTAPSQSAGGAGPANTPESKVSKTQEVPSGFALYDDPSGFRIAVPHGWHRSGVNDRGQVRFDKGDFEMLVVKGRDSTRKFGTDPMAYQSKDEPELQPYRTSHWATASGLRRIDVGGHAMAEGAFTWKDASGREVYVRNRALILDGRYHLVLVIGPADARSRVDHTFESVVDSYRVLRR